MSQVSTIRLDTNLTPNQGGTYSRSSIARGSPAIRTAAAEARQALCKWPRENWMRPSNVSLIEGPRFGRNGKRWSAKVSHVW